MSSHQQGILTDTSIHSWRITFKLQGRCTWEAETAGDARHHRADEVVQVAEGRRRQLEGAEADVI